MEKINRLINEILDLCSRRGMEVNVTCRGKYLNMEFFLGEQMKIVDLDEIEHPVGHVEVHSNVDNVEVHSNIDHIPLFTWETLGDFDLESELISKSEAARTRGKK